MVVAYAIVEPAMILDFLYEQSRCILTENSNLACLTLTIVAVHYHSTEDMEVQVTRRKFVKSKALKRLAKYWRH